jgi:hypothetical protein
VCLVFQLLAVGRSSRNYIPAEQLFQVGYLNHSVCYGWEAVDLLTSALKKAVESRELEYGIQRRGVQCSQAALIGQPVN